ncbi:MAG TPA: hypothetical protein VEK06_04935 [Myxococcota bacterium]|nr:hypothetical protein [Myxococcota bacterium]
MLMAPAFGEAFGNSAVFFPKFGMALFDKPITLHQKKPWGIPYQWMIGTAYMQAIDYRWWWVAETSFAMGHLSNNGSPFISSFMGGAGVRNNIFVDEFRPHTGIMIHYLQFFGDSVQKLPLNLGWPIFVGLKPYLGLEWLLGSEISLLFELAYALYINLNEPFRQVFYTQTALLIYF